MAEWKGGWIKRNVMNVYNKMRGREKTMPANNKNSAKLCSVEVGRWKGGMRCSVIKAKLLKTHNYL